MKDYYKVKLRKGRYFDKNGPLIANDYSHECKILGEIIVQKGVFVAKEVVSKITFSIEDDLEKQFNNIFVYKNDFNLDNLVSLEEVREYVDQFDVNDGFFKEIYERENKSNEKLKIKTFLKSKEQ